MNCNKTECYWNSRDFCCCAESEHKEDYLYNSSDCRYYLDLNSANHKDEWMLELARKTKFTDKFSETILREYYSTLSIEKLIAHENELYELFKQDERLKVMDEMISEIEELGTEAFLTKHNFNNNV